MKTLYRKVQIEINCKDHDEIWLIGKSANFIFNPNTRNGEELFDFLSCCEEIPDNTQLQPTEKLPSKLLKEYFKNTPREQVLKDWENTAHLDYVNSPKVSELFEGGSK